jgi:hypothetical protein
MKSSIQTITAAHSPQPPHTPTQVELLTQVQMAQRLGISRRTLHTWVLSGMVPMIKLRGFCRFEPAKVWAALQQHEVQAAGTQTSSSSSDSSSSSREATMDAAVTSTTETRVA